VNCFPISFCDTFRINENPDVLTLSGQFEVAYPLSEVALASKDIYLQAGG
jgi:hypothetical protein